MVKSFFYGKAFTFVQNFKQVWLIFPYIYSPELKQNVQNPGVVKREFDLLCMFEGDMKFIKL